MACVLLASIAGCGGDENTRSVSAEATDGGSEGTIKVGAVSSLSGPLTFPESSQAAQAYFDRVNSRGGVNGRKIQHVVVDDKGDPAAAAQAARQLVDREQVVANVASASLLECSINAPYYEQKGLLSIQGTGVDPVCFNAPNISPVNTGPFTGLEVSLFFASDTLKRDKVCVIGAQVQGFDDAWKAVIADWSRKTGQTLVVSDFTVKAKDDLTPFVTKVKSAGCNAVAMALNDFQVIAAMKAAKTQGATEIAWIALSSAYSPKVATAVRSTGIPLYANAEFEPYIGATSPALDDWRSLLRGAGVQESSFAEGGYIAAKMFVAALETIKGDVTRAAVTAALHRMTAFRDPLVGSPLSFAPAARHNSNQASKFVQIREGTWVTVSDRWIQVPR